MRQRNLARWPLFNKPRRELAENQPRPKAVQYEWNQEEESFRLGNREELENPRERMERLLPNFGDLKKIVF